MSDSIGHLAEVCGTAIVNLDEKAARGRRLAELVDKYELWLELTLWDVERNVPDNEKADAAEIEDLVCRILRKGPYADGKDAE